ncbi:hypothetical protein NBRC10512_006416 [Rhodotorula toruloides]|uniref:RHTO0S01e01376g1_1 n=2 Tax=Rhodotorula toruloides TaxID=5286 RepID=A0A061ADD5_RHOTO|nr:transcription coactivator, histone acetyltransferase [Rhodotorula toruloides NP11]EMS19809.1 transcription coactivator, histone acetyltransferase [Rhodotorula toruloides NP11]CDR35529.1 RHTO0S01e01376g1_1 [Rhodotorula toruloides]
MDGQTAGQPPPHRQAKPQQATIPPFDSPDAVVRSLKTRDAAALQAALNQIDKRAAALVAREAPRAQPDLLLDYLKLHPGCEGVFEAWDLANKTNNSPLSTAVLSCLTSLVRLASTDPFTPSPDLLKTLLSPKYHPYLERSLNPGRNDVTTASLKLCNVLVGFGGGKYARKVFGCFGWSPKVTSRLYKTRLRSLTSSNALSKPDIRTLLILLVLSFLSASDVRLKSQVLETKGLLSGVFKGLNEDPESVVGLVLEVVAREVVVERRVGLEARRNVFDEACINELVKLYDYPLPVGDDDVPPSHPSLSIHRFLQLLTTWLSDQIASSPPGRSSHPQRVLSTLLRALKVTESPRQRDLGLEILRSAPILAGAFWTKFPSSLDPRLSSRWVSAITFATQVVGLPVARDLSKGGTAPPPAVSTILDTILPPSTSSTLNRAWYTKSITHETPLVSFLSSLFLLSILQKAAKVLEVMAETSRVLEEGEGGRWAVQARKVRDELRNRLPDPSIVVGLMTKTAAAAAASAAAGKEKDGEATAPKKKDDGMAEGALLRTNVALRLLFLYHRVAPSLIATLKFDFAKLPQTYAQHARPASPSTDSTDAQGSSGLLAISSSYALRLAAAHSSSSNISLNRPGDHYKSSLVPLFQLYRTPATRSNRALLREILRRQLDSPLLFGVPGANAVDEGEVDVWLRALPVPAAEGTGRSATSEEMDVVLDFFAKCVQKTLTAPLKLEHSAQEAERGFSRLLATVVAELAANQDDAVRAFVKDSVLHFLAQQKELSMVGQLVDVLEEKLPKEEELVRLLRDCLAVAQGHEVVDGVVPALASRLEESEDDELASVVASLSPVKQNVFASLADSTQLQRVLAAMPLPLVLIHARATELTHPSIARTILGFVSTSSFHVPTVRLLLHRFVNGSQADEVTAFIVRAYGQAGEAPKKEIKEMLVAQEGLLGVFKRDGLSSAGYTNTVRLVGQVLDPTVSSDILLVQPFCDAVLADLTPVNPASEPPAKKRKRRSSPPPPPTGLSQRVLAAGPLLPFFATTSSLPLLEALLSHFSADPTTLDPASKQLLGSAFARVLDLPTSTSFLSFWSSQFSRLNTLLTIDGLEKAGDVLVKGADALLPFSTSSATRSKEWSSLPKADDWAAELLAGSAVSTAQAKTLAALVYRSTAARVRFAAWLAGKGVETDLVALAAPLEALVKVAEAKVDSNASVQPDIVAALVQQLATSPARAAAEALRAVAVIVSHDTSKEVEAVLRARLTGLGRDGFRAADIRLASTLARTRQTLTSMLEAFVNATFEGLVRRFAEDEEDGEEVRQLVEALTATLHERTTLSLTSNALSPLITAITTRRLDQPYATALGTALCEQQQLKDNEVTRHLNEIFASPRFHAFTANPTDSPTAVSSALALVLALASSSPTAAANARSVERLVPFYRGTLSPGDRSLLDLFQRIELVSGASVSPALRNWAPSIDSASLLDGTRIAAIAASQKTFVCRSWARAFASTRTSSAAEDDARTYDPHFIVPFVAALADEDDLKLQEWTTLLESGMLGTVVAALASSDNGLRGLARSALAALLKKAEPLAFREKDELVLVLTQVRLTIYSQAGEAIPSSIALFLAHCVSLIGSPESALYPPFMRFLLQRSTMDVRDVPLFYNMLYSSNTDEYAAAPREERAWMVRYLTEGLVRSQDWKIYRRRQVFELLASLFEASRQDPPLRKLVLKFLIRATSIPAAARELLSRNGLLGWLSSQLPLDIAERRLFLQVVCNMAQVVPWDKMAGVADVVEATVNAVGPDVTAVDAPTLLDLVRHVVTHLSPTSTSSSLLPLILSRLSDILRAVSATLDAPSASTSVQERFYTTVTLLAFVRYEANQPERKEDRELWSAAVKAGLKAGVKELEKETIRILSG